MKTRRLTPADAEALWHLRLAALQTEPQAFAESAAHHRSTPVSTYEERLRPSESGNAVFGTFDGPHLIGMAGMYRDQAAGRIWGMFVSPGYRARGVGRALIEAVIAHARTLDEMRELRLEVAQSQLSAERLYLRCGFRHCGPGPHCGREMLLALD